MKAVLRSIVVATALFTLAVGVPGIGSAEPGDVNGTNNAGDGRVDVFDALMTLQNAVGLYTPVNESNFMAAADVAPLDTDTCMPLGTIPHAVNVFDALAILRYAVGLDLWDGSCPVIPTYTISGKVTSAGSPLAGVLITAAADKSASTQTDGTYSLAGLTAGTYTLTPARSGYSFTPATQAVTVNTNVTQNFSATRLPYEDKWISANGSIDAAGANYVFHLQSSSSDYTYTIAHFGVHDQLVFPAGTRAPSINNESFTDGKVQVFMLSPGGGMITVELTGLTLEQDNHPIVGVPSFNTVFLPGSLTQQ